MAEPRVIRSAATDDAAAVAAVHVASLAATYIDLLGAVELDVGDVAATWRLRLRAPDGQLVVSTSAGAVVGFAWFGGSQDADEPDEHVGQVRSIHVTPDATGRGHGRGLLRAARDRLAMAGRKEATLWVVTSNHRAQHVYRSDGWRFDGARRREMLGLVGERAPEVEVVRMRRDLSSPR